jgi:hypothetical protein
MVLSNLSQQFIVYFSPNYFYPEVQERWLPVIKKLSIPYTNVEDFINAQIQSFNLPAINMQTVNQQWGSYKTTKRGGYNMDQQMDKQLTLTIKLTEGYTSYFIMRQQIELYYQTIKTKPLYWSPIVVDILDDFGHAIITYEQEQITPESISDLNLTYAAKLGSYNTFTVGLRYNFFDMWYLDSVTGKMIKQTQTQIQN